jgi:hypothetical protein
MPQSVLQALALVLFPFLIGYVLSRIIHWWVGFWMTLAPLSDERFGKVKLAYGALFNGFTEILAVWTLGFLFLWLVS